MAPLRSGVGVPKSTVENTRWSVIWLDKQGRRIEKKPGPMFPGLNFVDALELYHKVGKLGRRGLTLRCTNVGFPPPQRLLPHTITKVKRGRRREFLRLPLKKLNKRGIWWCPYCMRLRRFQRIINRRGGGEVHRCPGCDIPHWDTHVQAYNPIARYLSIKYPYNSTKKGS